MSNRIRVVIVDDHNHFRKGIKSDFVADDQISVVAEGSRGEDAIALVQTFEPDVLILDLQMRQFHDPAKADVAFSAFTAVVQLNQQYPDLAIVIVSAHVGITLIEDAFDRGVRGYILKDEMEDVNMSLMVRFAMQGRLVMSEAIKELLIDAGRGNSQRPVLTNRQIEIVQKLAKNVNLSTKALSELLYTSENTLRNKLSEIYARLAVRNKTACLLECIRYGYVSVDPLFYSTS